MDRRAAVVLSAVSTVAAAALALYWARFGPSPGRDAAFFLFFAAVASAVGFAAAAAADAVRVLRGVGWAALAGAGGVLLWGGIAAAAVAEAGCSWLCPHELAPVLAIFPLAAALAAFGAAELVARRRPPARL